MVSPKCPPGEEESRKAQEEANAKRIVFIVKALGRGNSLPLGRGASRAVNGTGRHHPARRTSDCQERPLNRY
jgi:hypothetical protein